LLKLGRGIHTACMGSAFAPCKGLKLSDLFKKYVESELSDVCKMNGNHSDDSSCFDGSSDSNDNVFSPLFGLDLITTIGLLILHNKQLNGINIEL
jgi:hypothetical protein